MKSIDDKRDYQIVNAAMKATKFSLDECNIIWKLLASILHLVSTLFLRRVINVYQFACILIFYSISKSGDFKGPLLQNFVIVSFKCAHNSNSFVKLYQRKHKIAGNFHEITNRDVFHKAILKQRIGNFQENESCSGNL